MIMTTVALLEANADPDDDDDPGRPRRQRLPLLHVPADPAGRPAGRRADSGLRRCAGDWGIHGKSRPGSRGRATAPPWDLTPATERDYFDLLPDGLVVVREPGPVHGGRAPGGWTTSTGAWLHVGADGQVTAFTGKVDVGQDNRTALSLRVAEELRVPLAAVRLVMGDTDLCPFDVGTFGSRSMPDAGEHLRRTAAAARECLVGLAAARWEIGPEGLVAEDGCVREPDGMRTVGVRGAGPRPAPTRGHLRGRAGHAGPGRAAGRAAGAPARRQSRS